MKGGNFLLSSFLISEETAADGVALTLINNDEPFRMSLSRQFRRMRNDPTADRSACGGRGRNLCRLLVAEDGSDD